MENNKKIFGLIAMSILTEAIITYTSQIANNGYICFKMIFSMILGIVISIAYSLDLPEYFNLKAKIPHIGNIITGIVISRGSNYVWDIISNISNHT